MFPILSWNCSHLTCSDVRNQNYSGGFIFRTRIDNCILIPLECKRPCFVKMGEYAIVQ